MTYYNRHVSSNKSEIHEILRDLGLEELEDISSFAIPDEIKTKNDFKKLGQGKTEYEMLSLLKNIFSKNKIFRSYIGTGYHDTITPPVIQRCFFENPAWYTAYTPYQAEISQGRLEALLNFQTMVSELTGMEIANASLLDEATAVAEAVAMAHALNKKGADTFLVSPLMHPQTLDVLKTRSEALSFKMIIANPETTEVSENVFAIVLQYPDTEGTVKDFSHLSQKMKEHDVKVIVAADILALTILIPPGEWGADIVVGSTQRFGVPMGFGGPHAGYLATREEYKRLIPGRLVGVSLDKHGNRALRLALQTREQHVRREKATSNICTAQVLLANMASMYAVYHGPEGLKAIANRVHSLTRSLAKTLKKLSLRVAEAPTFDTILIQDIDSERILQRAEKQGMNFRKISSTTLSISLDEVSTEEEIQGIVKFFTGDSIPLVKEEKDILQSLRRTTPFLTHPNFNSYNTEVEFTRYIHRLQAKDITLIHSMIPLGSCTMKLNSVSTLQPVSWESVNHLHPFIPLTQAEGYMEMITDLENMLQELTGFDRVSLQPNSGSQGEFAALRAIKKYHEAKGEGQRKICLIPSSAHGTNPASAAVAGLQVVVVNCDASGSIEVSDLIKKANEYKDTLSCIMLTYPSTHGVYEKGIKEISQIVHECGGQVYLDGANMNALLGICRIAELGADACHMNLHKTFAIPHGGGGPGVGPIGVMEHLKEYLPGHFHKTDSSSKLGAVSAAPWGSASILPISWAYIKMMGEDGLKKATLISVLNANYITKKLADHYPILYRGENGSVAHECILDLRPLKNKTGIDVSDVAKRLIDFGFHPPTMSFPVAGTLMIEPTETESKGELDRFISAMIKIREEIREIEEGISSAEDNVLRNSPHTAQELLGSWEHSYSREDAAYPLTWLRENKFWPPVGRIDNSYGDRNLVCSCPPVDSYKDD